MLSVVCWKWGALFSAAYVNRLRAAFERHLRLPHEVVCVTDDARGIDSRVRTVPLPTRFSDTPRCRRRMQVFSSEFASFLGERILSVDLDVVVVGDVTPLVDRSERIVCWLVDYAGVYSGSFLLMDAGALDPLWKRFEADPWGFPRSVEERGTPSDQAMLNWYLRGTKVPHWTERDGMVTYFGEGYEHLEHHGIGPNRTALPRGARVVVLGSADKRVMDESRYEWVRRHWTSLPAEAA